MMDNIPQKVTVLSLSPVEIDKTKPKLIRAVGFGLSIYLS